jgi:hypothetical protein
MQSFSTSVANRCHPDGVLLREFLMRLDSSDWNESLLEDDKNLVDDEAIPPDTRSRPRGESRFETVKLVLAFVAIYFRLFAYSCG